MRKRDVVVSVLSSAAVDAGVMDATTGAAPLGDDVRARRHRSFGLSCLQSCPKTNLADTFSPLQAETRGELRLFGMTLPSAGMRPADLQAALARLPVPNRPAAVLHATPNNPAAALPEGAPPPEAPLDAAPAATAPAGASLAALAEEPEPHPNSDGQDEPPPIKPAAAPPPFPPLPPLELADPIAGLDHRVTTASVLSNAAVGCPRAVIAPERSDAVPAEVLATAEAAKLIIAVRKRLSAPSSPSLCAPLSATLPPSSPDSTDETPFSSRPQAACRRVFAALSGTAMPTDVPPKGAERRAAHSQWLGIALTSADWPYIAREISESLDLLVADVLATYTATKDTTSDALRALAADGRFAESVRVHAFTRARHYEVSRTFATGVAMRFSVLSSSAGDGGGGTTEHFFSTTTKANGATNATSAVHHGTRRPRCWGHAAAAAAAGVGAPSPPLRPAAAAAERLSTSAAAAPQPPPPPPAARPALRPRPANLSMREADSDSEEDDAQETDPNHHGIIGGGGRRRPQQRPHRGPLLSVSELFEIGAILPEHRLVMQCPTTGGTARGQVLPGGGVRDDGTGEEFATANQWVLSRRNAFRAELGFSPLHALSVYETAHVDRGGGGALIRLKELRTLPATMRMATAAAAARSGEQADHRRHGQTAAGERGEKREMAEVEEEYPLLPPKKRLRSASPGAPPGELEVTCGTLRGRLSLGGSSLTVSCECAACAAPPGAPPWSGRGWEGHAAGEAHCRNYMSSIRVPQADGSAPSLRDWMADRGIAPPAVAAAKPPAAPPRAAAASALAPPPPPPPQPPPQPKADPPTPTSERMMVASVTERLIPLEDPDGISKLLRLFSPASPEAAAEAFRRVCLRGEAVTDGPTAEALAEAFCRHGGSCAAVGLRAMALVSFSEGQRDLAGRALAAACAAVRRGCCEAEFTRFVASLEPLSFEEASLVIGAYKRVSAAAAKEGAPAGETTATVAGG